MPRQETIYSIFVASPSDIQEERSRIQAIVNEWNSSQPQQSGIRLDLVGWETHAYPGISDDPQAVINNQVPDDYDIFVGIMWHRFGTPTKRAESGTIEEFQRAKERYDINSSSVKIMFYFKEAFVSPYELDLEQFQNVKNFRDSLKTQGVYYGTFSDADNFENLFRMHINRQVHELNQEIVSPSLEEPDPQRDEAVAEPSVVDEDMGLLELEESFEEKFLKLNEISNRISDHIRELGEQVSDRTDEINQLVEQFGGNPNRNSVKRLLTKTAGNMDEFVVRMEAELPIFGSSFDDGMEVLIRATQISHEFGMGSEDEFRKILEAINTLRETTLEVDEQMVALRSSIVDIPPITTKLKKSRAAATRVLDQFIEKLKGVENLTREAESIIGETLQN
ncbi:MAG: DUF4062 domain-containing protein [Nitrospinae bacterium]|nr:DUF4062 domain-containing protein [Nitrospinota bacterium]